MSRAKHLSMLILKICVLVLCFSAVTIMTSLQTYSTDEINVVSGMKNKDILVTAENGATATYEIIDGEIVFNIKQSGKNFDDISALIFTPKAQYDTSYLEEMLGDKVESEQEYITAMNKGPWRCNLAANLKANKTLSKKSGTFTLIDPDDGEYTEMVSSAAANKKVHTEDFKIKKNESVGFMLIFGSKKTGAMKSGKYTLSADINIRGLYEEGTEVPKLSFLDKVGIFTKVSLKAVKEKGWEIFSVTNWLTFYCIIVIIGWLIYLWRDAHLVFKIFMAVYTGDDSPGIILYNVYANGVYVGNYEDTSEDGAALLKAILIAGLCWILITITIPLRILWYLIRDIIYLFKTDEKLEEFSYIGNIIGSVGVYISIFGIVGLLGAGYILGGICLGVGIALCIIAHFVCHKYEEQYA